jgi:hypothetical protein
MRGNQDVGRGETCITEERGYKEEQGQIQNTGGEDKSRVREY